MELNLYTREGCHLCHRLEQMLEPWVKQNAITLTLLDIEENDAWYEMYWSRIPVLMVDDCVVVEGKPDETQLHEAMNVLIAGHRTM